MIKQAINRKSADMDYLNIQSAFCDTTFKAVIDMLDLVNKIPEASLDTVIIETFKQGKNRSLVAVVNQYA